MFTECIDSITGLRPLTVRDAAAFYEIVQSCRPYVNEWVPWAGGVGSIAEMRQIIQARISQADGRGPQFCMLEQDQVVGWVGYAHLDWEARTLEIEYWIGQAFQGRGTTTKCCRFLTQYAFDHLEVERVYICTAEGNDKSMRIPLRLGFKRETILVGADRIHGRDINLVLFSLDRTAVLG